MLVFYNLESFIQRASINGQSVKRPFRSFLRSIVYLNQKNKISFDKALDIPILLTFATIPLFLTINQYLVGKNIFANVEVFFVFLLYPIFKMIYDESSTRSFLSYNETLENYKATFQDFILTMVTVGVIHQMTVSMYFEIFWMLASLPFIVLLLSSKKRQVLENSKDFHEVQIKERHKRLILSASYLGDNIQICGFILFTSLIYSSKVLSLFRIESAYIFEMFIALFFVLISVASGFLKDFFPKHKYENRLKFQIVYIFSYFALFLVGYIVQRLI